MNRLKRILILVGVWLIVTSLYAYYYIVSILSLPEGDAYAMNWQFQLLMFSIFRLPYMVMLLAILIGMVWVSAPQTKSPRRSE